jgi:hypothetical protein
MWAASLRGTVQHIAKYSFTLLKTQNPKKSLNFNNSFQNEAQDQFQLPTFLGFQNCIKTPYKHTLLVPVNCSTKPLSLLLTKLLTAIKESF